jgi:hypothetical protein
MVPGLFKRRPRSSAAFGFGISLENSGDMVLLGYAKSAFNLIGLYEPLQFGNVYSPLKAQDLAPFLAISRRSGRDRLTFVKLSNLHV